MIKASKISKIMYFFGLTNQTQTSPFTSVCPPPSTHSTNNFNPTNLIRMPGGRLDGHPHASRLMHSGLDLGDTDTLGRYTVVDSQLFGAGVMRKF